jgi:hypothetical protein
MLALELDSRHLQATKTALFLVSVRHFNAESVPGDVHDITFKEAEL